MMLNSVAKVQARIAEIEGRFNPKKNDLAKFANYLKKAEEKEDFTSVGRKSYQRSSASYEKGSIKQMLVEAARKHGINEELVLAVANAESGYRADAVSSAGAVGVMQLMPGTAQSLGVEDSFDPVQNIDGGVRYLKQMLGMFGGDTAKALAAYNAGPGAVQKYGGIPPYDETQNYVRNILSDLIS